MTRSSSAPSTVFDAFLATAEAAPDHAFLCAPPSPGRAYQMDHSEAELAVSIPARVAALEAVARERAKPLPVIDAEALPASLPRASPTPRAGAPGLDSECSLLYTSGTTGRPKGCILTNFYYLNAGAWYRDLGGRLAIEHGRERFMNPLPLFHMNSQAVTATCAILTSNCLVLPERFSPRRWWPEVAAARATIIHYLGVMPPLLLNQEPVPEERHPLEPPAEGEAASAFLSWKCGA